jgi:hypothetical protein
LRRQFVKCGTQQFWASDSRDANRNAQRDTPPFVRFNVPAANGPRVAKFRRVSRCDVLPRKGIETNSGTASDHGLAFSHRNKKTNVTELWADRSGASSGISSLGSDMALCFVD